MSAAMASGNVGERGNDGSVDHRVGNAGGGGGSGVSCVVVCFGCVVIAFVVFVMQRRCRLEL